MPGWSTEIANEFIRLAAAEGGTFTQMHLQELVYIAHGWCLALTGQPLTGDRPEALENGPEYQRLADALVKWGIRPVMTQIPVGGSERIKPESETVLVDADLEATERDIIARVYLHYGSRETSELAVLSRDEDTPWARIYAGGTGKARDIPHKMIRNQFAELAAKSTE